MLTAKNTQPQQAVDYFMEDADHELNSRWSGKAAKKLGLSGPINNKEVFANIVNGRSPDGTQALCARTLNSSERRAATDFTFSAPKSVSLQALVGGDERLIDAHRLAVRKTLKLIEERYSHTRITTDAGRKVVKTGNLIVAEFDHIESRELDPHLHTHALVINMTQLEDGKWQSLSNQDIFRNKKFLGMVYQHNLALEVQRLGYEVEPRRHGQFEIKGFREQDLEEFSKRRQQILKVVPENSTWAQREGAWNITRKAKQKVPPEELKAKWQEEAEALDIQFVDFHSPQPEFRPAIITQEHLDAAIAHCSERDVAFSQEDLEKFILEQGLATDISQIDDLIKENSELLSLSTENRDFTTLKAVQREIATIRLMQSGQDKVSSIAHPEIAEAHLQQTSLNSDQRKAVFDAATTSDQFVAWQGVAGAGKTFALKEFKAIAAASGYTIKGFAPSSMAANVLGKELDIQAETVASLLSSEPPEEIELNQIWLVDEAGLLSAEDALTLLQRAKLEQARLLMVGDTKQLSSVNAGNPFKSLQQAGIKTSYLNQSNRQRAPQLKLAVDLVASGAIEEGFKRLDENGYINIVSSDSKVEAIANDYVAATPSERKRTLVLAGTNFERLAITQAIREKLKAEGTLGTAISITQLKAKDLTSVQMRYTHNFEVGDTVMPTRSYKRRGLEKGKLYKVVGKAKDKLTLESPDGQHFQVDTEFRKAVYQLQHIEIAEGDRLRWTKNDRQLGRRNGQEFIVRSISGNTAEIQYLDSNQTESINLSDAQHLDYALVSTTYSSQGKTADKVLVSADTTIGQESFYVAVSRAKYDLKIYTEDKEELLSLAQSSKSKENALYLLRQKELEKQRLEQFENGGTVATKTKTSSPSDAKTSSENSTTFSPPILKKLPEIPFWTPTNTEEPPERLDPKHWRELVEGSAIHPAIATLNFKSLQQGFEWEHEAWEYLMYSENLPRTNTGRLSTGMITKYSHIEDGGWWCDAGVNPKSFTNLQSGDKPDKTLWGCYKPNNPREKPDKPGKFIKYEHPPKTDLSIFLLDVPDEIADRIYKKYGVEPSQSDRASGFWYCVWKHNIPVTITEGAKKAASLLTQGHAAIGLPGIYAGYRSKDEFGEKVKAKLMDELAVFGTPDRKITFCFDYETKPDTKRNIDIAISRTGALLQKQGAKVKVATLPGTDKGVDDLIVSQGALAYEKVNFEAKTLREWRNQTKQAFQQPLPKSQKPDQEQNNDNYQQSQQSAIGGNGTAISESREADTTDRAIGIENSASRRISINGLDRILESISRYIELQEIERIAGIIGEINRDIIRSGLRGEGAAPASDSAQQFNTTIPSSPESNVTVGEREKRPKLDNESVHDKALKAISEYVELSQVESPEIAQAVGQVIEQLKQLPPSQQPAYDKALKAISEYVELSQVESPEIAQAVGQVIEQLKQLPPSQQPAYDKALKAISEYVELSQVESPEIAQAVGQVIEQLKQLPPSQQPAYDKALKAISEYVELSQVERPEIAQAVGQVIEQLKQLPSSQQLAYDKALKAISEYVELSQVESSEIAQAAGQVIEQLKQLPSSKELDQLPAIASFIDSLSDQDLLYLEQIVNEYLSETQIPTPIDKQSIEHQVNNLKSQIDSLWMQHAEQEKTIKFMERLPLHELSKKYNSLVNQQLNTINTINKLFIQKQQLENSIQEWKTQTQNYEAWAQKKETIEMNLFSETLQSPQIQKRLNTIMQEQQQQANIETTIHNTLKPSKSIRLRR
ncbi:MobF family relaxase [Anabaena azotica]|uniref:Relaxase domain-containing protein n=1 Tax=Anabaena azotica FACHB-119 TaxID=947527 RepID=A0ABR8D9L9_9NOST|nr:MobF family relaxase [Anabaena azotica]MBD2503895.1 relaxase domain-containing protein [Anabaena azotica FACHB-119]